jgi:polyphosphate kinase
VRAITQEASWLSFNRRVLEQANRPDFPVLERLRFLGIWSSNMDEFFAARISRAFLEDRRSTSYLELMHEAKSQSDAAGASYLGFLPELERLGIQILDPAQLTRSEQQFFGAYLAEEVVPLTDPIEADAMSDLNSQALYFAAGNAELESLVRLPESLPRVLPVPGREGAYVRLGALVRMRSDLFLPTQSQLFEFRLVRLAQLARSRADWDELPEALETRLDGVASHLELESGFPQAWAKRMCDAFELQPHEVFELPPPLDLSFVGEIVDDGPSAAKFERQKPSKPKGFIRNPWDFLEKRDLILYHPFEDYGMVESFAMTAARDPQVQAMRATLYRIGRKNGIADALLEAAKAGKDVAVLLEGRARFDELSNLEWSLRFQGAGVRVLPLPDRKVHAKALYVRRAGHEFAHLGTGNYNPINGRLYTDLSMFTARREITADLRAFFAALEEERTPELKLLHTTSIREALVAMILQEAHPKGQVILKFNHITDPEIIAALEQARSKGCEVHLIVRSTLTTLWDDVGTRSIIGRYLEHARIAAFRNKGSWNVWAASADAMPRNLDGRFELMFPILSKRGKRKVLEVLNSQLEDDRNAYILTPEGQQARWGGKHDGQGLPQRKSARAKPQNKLKT